MVVPRHFLQITPHSYLKLTSCTSIDGQTVAQATALAQARHAGPAH
jgi:hypothetical protein